MRSSAFVLLLLPVVASAADIDFNRDVRPILSDRCFKCHGPATQKAKVRLDSLDHAKKKDAIVPGKPADSLVIDRITTKDAKDRMPPADSGPPLTDAQVKTLLVNEAKVNPSRLLSILHYDGTPITARYIVDQISRHAVARTVVPLKKVVS